MLSVVLVASLSHLLKHNDVLSVVQVASLSRLLKHNDVLSVVQLASLSHLLKPLPWPAVDVLLTAAGLWDPNRPSSATHLYRTATAVKAVTVLVATAVKAVTVLWLRPSKLSPYCGYGRQSCHRTGGYGRQSCHRTVATAVKAVTVMVATAVKAVTVLWLRPSKLSPHCGYGRQSFTHRYWLCTIDAGSVPQILALRYQRYWLCTKKRNPHRDGHGELSPSITG